MQSAHLAHEIVAGTQMQMIRVGEDERCPNIDKIAGQHGFDRRLGADGREYGRENIAVRGVEDARAGAMNGDAALVRLLFDDLKIE